MTYQLVTLLRIYTHQFCKTSCLPITDSVMPQTERCIALLAVTYAVALHTHTHGNPACAASWAVGSLQRLYFFTVPGRACITTQADLAYWS